MDHSGASPNRSIVLRCALRFTVLAIIAGIFGFTGISTSAAGIAKVILFLFVAFIEISLLFGGMICKKV